MPYRRNYRPRYNRRRMRGRRRRYYRPRYNRRNNNRSELKFVNDVQIDTAMNFVGSLFLRLTISDQIVQGVTNQQRIGDFIKPITNHGTITVNSDISEADVQTRFRLFFFIWKELIEDPTSPSLDQLLEDATDPWSPFKVSQRGTFKVLWSRKSFVINNADNTYVSRVYNYKFNMARLPQMTYDGATPNRNHLIFVGISDSAEENTSTYTINNMFRYTDS